MLAVVTGGSGSGKSAYAEQLVVDQGEGRRYYIATMRPWDQECEKKIEKHRVMREKKQFETIECYQDLHLVSVVPGSVILLECISNLAANEFYRTDCRRKETAERIWKGILHLQKQAETFIIVTNEVFSDGTNYQTETLDYMEQLAEINKRLAQAADQVTEVVYAIPVAVK